LFAPFTNDSEMCQSAYLSKCATITKNRVLQLYLLFIFDKKFTHEKSNHL
jgi:hypothetical protein